MAHGGSYRGLGGFETRPYGCSSVVGAGFKPAQRRLIGLDKIIVVMTVRLLGGFETRPYGVVAGTSFPLPIQQHRQRQSIRALVFFQRAADFRFGIFKQLIPPRFGGFIAFDLVAEKSREAVM